MFNVYTWVLRLPYKMPGTKKRWISTSTSRIMHSAVGIHEIRFAGQMLFIYDTASARPIPPVERSCNSDEILRVFREQCILHQLIAVQMPVQQEVTELRIMLLQRVD